MNQLAHLGVTALMFLFVPAGCAQERPDGPPPREVRGRAMGPAMEAADPGALYELLDLNDEQKAKVAEILEANAPRLRRAAGPGRDGERGPRFEGGKRGGPRGDGPGADGPRDMRRGHGPDGHCRAGGPGEGRREGPRGDGPPPQEAAPEMSAKDLKAKREKVHAEILAVLTPKQKKKAEALKAQLDKGTIPKELIDLRISKLDDRLKLTGEQKKNLAVLMKEKGGELLECRATCEEGKECAGKHRELGRAYIDGMRSILTANQWDEYVGRFNRRHQDGSGRVGKDGRVGRMRGIMRNLDLSDEQKDKLRDIMKESFDDGRPPRGDHEAMQARHEEVRTKIRAILTPEQQKKFDGMKPPADGPRGGDDGKKTD